ncbi:hypothetical protein BH11ARM1_BH11ARM1_18250 [soil metagenome]
MRTRSYLAASLLVVGLTTFSFAVDQEQARQVFVEFLQKLKPSISQDELSKCRADARDGDDAYFWTSNVLKNATVDIDTGKILHYSDAALETALARPPFKGKPHFASQAEFIAASRALCAKINWQIGERDFTPHAFPKVDGQGLIPHQRIGVDFEQVVNGFEVRGGNFVDVSLDSLTGEPISLQRGLGYTFGPSTASITSEQALQIAQKDAGDVHLDSVEPLRYYQMRERGDVSSRAVSAFKAKQMLLAYWVKGPKSYFVAADNGEILCSLGYTSGGDFTNKNPQPSKSQGPGPIVFLAPLGLAVGLIGIVALRSRTAGEGRKN